MPGLPKTLAKIAASALPPPIALRGGGCGGGAHRLAVFSHRLAIFGPAGRAVAGATTSAAQCRPQPRPLPWGFKLSNTHLHHRYCRFLPGACFLSKSPILGSMNASLVCCANPNNNRPRNSDILRQQKGGLLFGEKNKIYQENMTVRTFMILMVI